MPFDPDAYLAKKPAFDPDAYLAKSKPQADTVAQLGESALGGAQQGLLAGYAPQVAGGMGYLMEKLGGDKTDEELRAKGFKLPESSPYTEYRDAETKRQKGLEEQAPIAYGLGGIGGAVASAPLMAGAATKALGAAGKLPGAVGALSEAAQAGMKAKDLGLLGRTAQSAVGGAVQGAVQNPGDVEGKINPLQLEERGENLKTGGIVGAAIPAAGAAMGAVGKGIAKLGSKAEDLANLFSARALGTTGRQAQDLSKMDPTGMKGETLKKLGKFVSDTGIVKPGDGPTEIANKAAEFKQKIGAQIGEIYDRAETMLSGDMPKILDKESKATLKATTFDRNKMIKELTEKAEEEFKGKVGGKQALATIQGALDDLADKPKKILGIKDMQEFKVELDDAIFQAGKKESLGEPKHTKQSLMLIRDYLKDRIEARLGAMDEVFGHLSGDPKNKSTIASLKALNEQYGLASKAKIISENHFGREQGNKFLSLTDKIIGAEALGAGLGAAAGGAGAEEGGGVEGALSGAAKGLLFAGASKAARNYALPPAVAGFRAIAKGAQNIPSALPSMLQKGAGLVTSTPAEAGAAAANIALQRKKK